MPSRRDHFVKNQWLSSSGLVFSSRNPATEEMLWQGNAATDVEVNAAIEAANAASSGWANLSVDERFAFLQKFRELLVQSEEHLSETISKEVGKPLWESRGEVRSMAAKVNISHQAYQERCPEVVNEHPYGKSIRRHKPHGVLAVFGPFNFPGHLPHSHIIPALLAGNTIVFKPSELTPLVAEEIFSLWEKCSLPAGVINMVQGGRDTGHILTGNIKGIDGLLFTGSWETGVVFSELLGKHPEKILALELGGNNPLVVTEVANLDAAAYMTIQSAFLTSGQRCSCARRLIVPKGSKGDAFISRLVQMIESIKVGAYNESPEPFMGPVISEHSAHRILAVQEALKHKGGISLVEVHLKKMDSALLQPGLMDVTAVHHRPDEEIFGPFLQLIRVDSFDAAIEEANKTAFGLTAGLLSDSHEEYAKFYKQMKAGVINWNTPLTGASSAAPFGGIGRSGNHRPSGYYAADYCAYPVASVDAEQLVLPKELTPGIGFFDK